MSGFNDYNTNQVGGGNSGEQKYETPYQTGNDANTMSGLGGDQSRTGYASSGAAGPTADNMNAGGFNDTQGSGGAGTGLGMMGSERTGMGYGQQGSTGGGDFQDDVNPETGRFSETQGRSTGGRETSGFNTSSGGAENYGREDPDLSGGNATGQSGHKASMMDKVRGTTEKVGGKMTGNPEMASRGEERKRGEL
ncbi:hypothetical protein PENSPDRAFT_687338 [Peniophora sp. CONT]|nr:hypothetical protein PENSPDRAFT_687338 [Peniophora sp. CONT]